jgi:voltage-dependent calcium channel L type alpha-1D
LRLDNKIRKKIIIMTEWVWFDRLLMLLITLNSICLAIYDYQDRVNISQRNIIINAIGQAFNVIFILESLLKVIAKGFVMHKNAYLRDGWNVLDFVVVLSCFLEFMPFKSASFKGIRALRSLRPLKSINAVPSMKKLVKILLISLPNLADVFTLLAYIILLFGILGLYLFCGNLYYRCRTTEKPVDANYWPILEDYESLCYQDVSINTCPESTYCGHPS